MVLARIFQFVNGIFRRELDIEFVVIKLRNLENYERKKIGYHKKKKKLIQVLLKK